MTKLNFALFTGAFMAGLYIMLKPSKKLSINGEEIPQSELSRGYRNNNPINIRISSNDWKGKIPVTENTDGTFEQFTSPLMGFRAAALNILNYAKLYGVTDVGDIIDKWAPSHGTDPKTGATYINHTEQYKNFVAEKTNGELWWGARIDKTNVARLVWAMAQFENAPPHPYDLNLVEDAVQSI